MQARLRTLCFHLSSSHEETSRNGYSNHRACNPDLLNRTPHRRHRLRRGHIALEMSLKHPEAVLSLTLVSAGSGQTNKEGFRKECLKKADELEQHGLKGLGDYSRGPNRRRFEMKAPETHKAYFVDGPFSKHSAKGRANTLRGFQVLLA